MALTLEGRLASYGGRQKFDGTLLGLTPRQRRRIRHKLGHAQAAERRATAQDDHRGQQEVP